MPKRSPALLLAEALTFHGRYGAETEDQAVHRRLQRNQMAATELLRLDALRLELQTQLADYKEACTKAETRADQAEGRAKLLACAWIKATDAVPQESDGEVFVRFSDGSIGTGWATYWHGSSNDFARWTFPDPDEFRLVSEWAKNVPASTGMHWTENEPVRLPQARTGRVYLAGPMTGLPKLNFPAFNQEAERLRAEGLQVLNPADHGIVDGADWADYLRHDIAGLASCERIHLLRGWTKSKGACLEMTIAKALGMTVTYQVDAEMEHSNAPAVPQGPICAALGDIVSMWDRNVPSEYVTPLHMQAKRALEGMQPVSPDMQGWCAYVGGMVAHWIRSEPDAFIQMGEDRFESAISGIIERRLWAMPKAAATPAPAPAQEVVIPHGYEVHELPPDYSGPVWIESQVRQLARQTACASQPATDAGVLEDAQLLDWIERQDLEELSMGLVIDAPHDGEYYVNGDDGVTYCGKTLRDALRAARAKGRS